MNNKDQIKIFIVEDNIVFTLALKADIEASFTNRPVKIYTFETGEECKKTFNLEKPQVVILDYYLNSKNPNAENGINVLDWIKKEKPETNVIMLTNNDNLDIALKSIKHGVSDYVVKTETKFRKINISLSNIFKLMEEKNRAKRYMYMAIGLSLSIALMVGGLVAIQIFEPSVFK